MKIDNEHLRQLILETCKYPPGSLERKRNLTKLIIGIQQTQKLWRENTQYYQDALQQTWIFLCQHLCEADTGQKYDPDRSSITTWLNGYLKWRLQDFRIAQQADKKNKVTTVRVSNSETVNIVDNLAANPDIPPILEDTIKWAKEDLSGELGSIHIKGYPQITCQKLILRRLPPETSWQELSQEFGISISTLSNFYQRQCMPRLRNFAQSEGYINERNEIN